jgi:hypothetical protein
VNVSGGKLVLRGCRLTSPTRAFCYDILQSGAGIVEVDSATVFDSTKVSGTVVRTAE